MKRIAGGLLVGLLTTLALWPKAEQPGEIITPSPEALSREGRIGPLFATSPQGPVRPVWSQDQVLVSVSGEVTIGDIVDAYGGTVLREGRTAAAVLVPEGLAPADFLRSLQADPRVRFVGRQGITHGAGLDPEEVQWHMQATDFDETDSADVSGYVVAVLDTGVAYEAHSDKSGAYVQAPSFSETVFVAPRDFVNGDNHPNDDHQHGTHIASIIASQGELPGVVPGVAVMPLKVLDADNAGTELDLIDAIWWAVDNGADVINMSLTFGPGYTPSLLMQEALEAAAEAGVVMVGAAGNDGLSVVGWPAASPLVIAVGSGCPVDGDEEAMVAAPYTNRDARVDIIAPGGCVDRDDNDDGVPDGIIAESIGLQSPGEVGYWLYAGTSQAAAVVSGAAVMLLEAGSAPEDVRLFLQDKADDDPLEHDEEFVDGLGAGQIDVEDAVEKVWDEPDKFADRRYHASVMPWLAARSDGSVVPAAIVTVLDEDLDPAEEVTVYGRFTGSTTTPFSCSFDEDDDDDDDDDDGSEDSGCTVYGEATDPDASGGVLGWEVTVDRVVRNDESYTPGPLLFASEGLEVVTESILDDSPLKGAVLGVYWEAGYGAGLGKMAESLVVLNAGTGIATSPMAVLLSQPLADALGHDVPLRGTGISTSPFDVRRIDLKGTGIATSPMGPVRVIAIGGTGISTSPFHARSLLTLAGAEDADWDGDFDGEPVALNPDGDGDDFEGTSIGEAILSGGWVTRSGQGGASVVAGSGVISGSVEVTGHGSSAGAVPFEE